MTSNLKLKPSDVLAKAADLIEPEGKWCQGSLDRGGAHCVVGALAEFVPSDMEWRSIYEPLQRVIGERHPVSWNDRAGRTQAEVVAALRKASTLARSEGC